MNILLVEDEPPILRDIKKIVESLNEEYHVCGVAYNGKQAIDLIEKGLSIDLIITDLQMPGIGGLKLIEYVNKYHQGILSIILTGYSEFEYAQSALKLGVEDYILKPVDEKQIEVVLKTAQKKVKHHSLKKVIKNWENPKIEVSYTQTGLCYTAVTICLGCFPIYAMDVNYKAKSLWEKCDLQGVISEYISGEETFWIVDGQTSSEKNVVFEIKKTNAYKIQDILEKLFDKLKTYDIPVTIVFQDELKHIEEVGASIKKQRDFLSKRIVIGKSQIQSYHENISCSENVPLNISKLEDISIHLVDLFDQLNLSAFKKELSLLITEMEKANVVQSFAFNYLSHFVHLCIAQKEQLNMPKNIHYDKYIADAVIASHSFKELYFSLLEMFEHFIGIVIKQLDADDEKMKILLRLELYIQLQYNKPITMINLAEIFGFTPTYLSKIFKEYKEMSPIEYMVYLRVNKAKELFTSNPDMLIKDVSEYIGYEDSLYFSKVFKKHVGLSPLEFKKKLLE